MNWIFSVNSDGLSPLDVAVLSNNRPLAKMLVAFGAQEGNQCKYLANSMLRIFHFSSPRTLAHLDFRSKLSLHFYRYHSTMREILPVFIIYYQVFFTVHHCYFLTIRTFCFFFNRRRNDEKFIIFG